VTCTELPPVLRALVDSRAQWQTPQEIACALSLDINEVLDEIVRLRVEGYVDLWPRSPRGPAITFSAWGAAVLGCTAAENPKGSKSVYRWIRGKADPNPPRRRLPRGDEGASAVELAEDRGLGPDQVAEFVEDFESLQARRRERRERRGLPVRPEDVMTPAILYLGHALWPWHERDKGKRPAHLCRDCVQGRRRRQVVRPACRCGRGLRRWPEPAACPGCGDHIPPGRRSHYCLRCSRWGWDPVFSPDPRQARNDRTA
jgi:hypothetical protein